MGLCFKIWDTGAVRAPPGSQCPTQNYMGELSTFSVTEGWEGVWPPLTCGPNTQASDFIIYNIIPLAPRGVGAGIAGALQRGEGGSGYSALAPTRSAPRESRRGCRVCPKLCLSPLSPARPGDWSSPSATLELLLRGPHAPQNKGLAGGCAVERRGQNFRAPGGEPSRAGGSHPRRHPRAPVFPGKFLALLSGTTSFTGGRR